MAAAPFGTNGVLFLGGSDAAGAPLDTVQSLSGASVQAAGTSPAGEASRSRRRSAPGSTVWRTRLYDLRDHLHLRHRRRLAPRPTADAAIAVVGDTAYVIGGFNGSAELNTIVAFHPW